jgi:hypothetical protein
VSLLIYSLRSLVARQLYFKEVGRCDRTYLAAELRQIWAPEVKFSSSFGGFCAMAWSVNMDVGADGVAVITINNPPVNSLALHG